MMERLQKILAQSGIASRRKSEELIKQGAVKVNGKVVTELGTKADPAHDRIECDKILIPKLKEKIYLLLNKPKNYVTTLHDPEGRPAIGDIIRFLPERLYPVGRLDYDTEGLLILTNDGDIAQILQHPRYNIPKIYLIKVKGFPEEIALRKLRKGIYLDGYKTRKVQLKLHKKLSKNTWFELTLWEGRNRQIKRMFEAVGHPVLRIVRIALGPFRLDINLSPGEYRQLNREEIKLLRNMEVDKG